MWHLRPSDIHTVVIGRSSGELSPERGRTRPSRLRTFIRGIARHSQPGDAIAVDPSAALKESEPMRTSAKYLFSHSRENGQTMVEYAVVLGVITIAIVATLSALSGGIGSAVTAIVGRV
jgi:Flp pilus assembly pilin Flp